MRPQLVISVNEGVRRVRRLRGARLAGAAAPWVWGRLQRMHRSLLRG